VDAWLSRGGRECPCAAVVLVRAVRWSSSGGPGGGHYVAAIGNLRTAGVRSWVPDPRGLAALAGVLYDRRGLWRILRRTQDGCKPMGG